MCFSGDTPEAFGGLELLKAFGDGAEAGVAAFGFSSTFDPCFWDDFGLAKLHEGVGDDGLPELWGGGINEVFEEGLKSEVFLANAVEGVGGLGAVDEGFVVEGVG